MRSIFCLLLPVALQCAVAQSDGIRGLLVMAHGGDSTWNSAVRDAVASIDSKHPTSIAFGMANPETLQEAVNELERVGVTEIGVVRLFMSSESFLPETEYLFGLRTDPPAGHGHDTTPPTPLRLSADVTLGTRGLLDEHGLGGILADRALSLSSDPVSETVLILGHGPGDDLENERWLQRMNAMADSVRTTAPFHRVVVNTLREDWTGKRKAVETELRELLRSESAAGRDVLVVPFRLYGFGPYADVFGDLPYRADSLGLLPDPRITAWILNEFAVLDSPQTSR